MSGIGTLAAEDFTFDADFVKVAFNAFFDRGGNFADGKFGQSSGFLRGKQV